MASSVRNLSSRFFLAFALLLAASLSRFALPASAQAPDATAAGSATTTLATLVEQAKGGGASLDEVAHAFVETALKGAALPLPPEKLHEELPGIGDEMAPILKKAIEEHLPSEKVAKLAKLRELLPVLPPEEAEKYTNAFEACEQADAHVEAGNSGALQTLSSKVSPNIRKFLEVRQKALETISSATSAGTSPLKGLELLSELPPCGQNPKAHEQALTLLKSLSGQNPLPAEAFGPLASNSVQQLIRDAIGAGPARAETAALYDRAVRLMIERPATEHLLDNFRMLVELRPDPDEQNTALRMFAATHASTPELMYFAVGRVDEMRQAKVLGSWKKLRLIFSGYYGVILPTIVVIMVIMLAIGSGFIVYHSFQFRKREVAVAADEEEFQREHNESINKLKGFQRQPRAAKPGYSTSTGRKPRGYVQPMHGEDEYSRLLSFFGLDDSATESDIKRAYRDKVKNYHPDSAGKDASTSEAERTTFFIEAKETYDRILEIRGSWFGAKPK